MSSQTEISEEFRRALSNERVSVDARLDVLLNQLTGGAPAGFREALRYVVLAGGKRLRPILCLWTHDALGGEAREACLDVAAALEYLHTYTLVHDDLPCMDDDDVRRGQPSAHRKFNEATAVLAGDALQALCFEIIATLDERQGTSHAAITMLTRTIAEAAGTRGLITGQVLDVDPDSVDATVEGVDTIHRHKTAALIQASMVAGAILAGASEGTIERVRQAGVEAGVAFQIIDDILDVETDQETLGKTPGKDAQAGKRTYPAVIGLEASRANARDRIAGARDRLGLAGSRIDELLGYLVERTR